MTERAEKETAAGIALKSRELILGFMGIFALALTVRNADVAGEYVKRGLELCATAVIPSLFPFMVVANLVSVVEFPTISRMIDKPMRKILGVGGGCVPILLLGNLCGLPVGAKLGSLLVERGRVDKSELERALIFSCNPSSAFVISAVGGSLFFSWRLGVGLYAVTILSSLFAGSLCRVLFYREEKDPRQPRREGRPNTARAGTPKGFGARFTEAVGDSALSVIGVCGFVLFFTAFMGVVGNFCEGVFASQPIKALLFCFFEMTGGAAQAALLTGDGAVVAAAFALGWSGVSAHLQVFSLVEKCGVDIKRYLFGKLLQGIASALLVCFLLRMGIF